MKINRNNTEIFDQAHQMYAEGSEDFCVEISEIKEFLFSIGYQSYNEDIFFDNVQKCYRWTADIRL
jgi:hypothetical protein